MKTRLFFYKLKKTTVGSYFLVIEKSLDAIRLQWKAGLKLLKSEQAMQIAPNKTIKDFVCTKYNCYFATSK